MSAADVLLVRDLAPATHGLQPNALVHVRDENAPLHRQLRLAGRVEELDGQLVVVVPRAPAPGEGER